MITWCSRNTLHARYPLGAKEDWWQRSWTSFSDPYTELKKIFEPKLFWTWGQQTGVQILLPLIQSLSASQAGKDFEEQKTWTWAWNWLQMKARKITLLATTAVVREHSDLYVAIQTTASCSTGNLTDLMAHAVTDWNLLDVIVHSLEFCSEKTRTSSTDYISWPLDCMAYISASIYLTLGSMRTRAAYMHSIFQLRFMFHGSIEIPLVLVVWVCFI